MEIVECIRGTNHTECFHRNLALTFESWYTRVEMSDCLLSERRHRHNQRCAERRRFGYPKLGHYDTWLIDQLQILVLRNHGRVLYPNWSNASEYKETSESFDTVAIHNSELHNALNEQWENKVVQNDVRLTSDQKYLCASMGKKCLSYLLLMRRRIDHLLSVC